MSDTSKNILVIGGSGFIGSHTADILSENGHKVTILDKVSSNWKRDDQEIIIADIMNQKVLESSMKSIEVVYYFAGIADIRLAKSNPYETIELNIMGLTKALEAALKNRVKKFIYASTMYVYSSHGSFYRASKQAAEIIIETYQENFGLEYVFLRYGSLYGPRAQNWNGIRGFIEQVIEKGFLEYHGNGAEVREYIHVLDAAKLSVKALEKEYRNRSVTITGQQSIKARDMLSMIFEIVGKKVDIRYLNKVEGTSHYGITPYRYTPKESMKLIPVEFFDLGQGILNIVKDIYNNK